MFIISLMAASVTSSSRLRCYSAMNLVEQSRNLEKEWRIWKLVRSLFCCGFYLHTFVSVYTEFTTNKSTCNLCWWKLNPVTVSLGTHLMCHKAQAAIRKCISEVKTYSTQADRECCLRQSSKSIFGLVWSWHLTSWPHSWSFCALAPRTTCANWHHNWFIVFTSLVTYEQTNEQIGWEHCAFACQSGLIKA